MSDADLQQQDYEARFGRKMTYETAGKLRDSGDFKTEIDRFVVDTEKKLLFVMRNAISDLVADANKNKKDGGRVPIDTGFLWNSGVATLNSPPTGPVKGDKKQTYTWSASTLVAALARMNIGDTFYFGWTAGYARYMEARNGFLESALMNWQKYVNDAVAKVKK